jgi:hypothetical protein
MDDMTVELFTGDRDADTVGLFDASSEGRVCGRGGCKPLLKSKLCITNYTAIPPTGVEGLLTASSWENRDC